MGKDSGGLLHGVTIAVIGPVTAKAVEKAGLHVDIMPKEATIEAMVSEIVTWVRDHNNPEKECEPKAQ